MVRHLPAGSDPELAALHPDGRRLFVANEDDNMVTVVDVERGVVLREIPVGVEPEGMGISPDGRWVVNTSETTNMAHVIEADSRRGRGERAGRRPPARGGVGRRTASASGSPPRSAAR